MADNLLDSGDNLKVRKTGRCPESVSEIILGNGNESE